jgi:hypothetical protein
LGAAVMAHPARGAGMLPYVLAGVGYYELEEGGPGGISSPPINGIGIMGGAGISARMGRVRAFLEGRFIGGPVKHGVNFIPVSLGLSI